jgi:hypothetical protein
MRTEFASGSLVESIVTLAAAALMTIAGLAMVQDLVPVHADAATIAACTSVPAPAG